MRRRHKKYGAITASQSAGARAHLGVSDVVREGLFKVARGIKDHADGRESL